MKNKIIRIFLAILASLSLITFSTIPTYAAENSSPSSDICGNSNVPEEVKQASGCGGATTALKDVIINILYGIIGILGLIAVIFIIKGGIEYMTSSGDTVKLQKARSTIIYAVIGLIVSVLAFVIVNFTIDILSKTNSNQNDQTTPNNQTNQRSV